MRPPKILEVDLQDLHLLPSQAGGADAFELQAQLVRVEASAAEMPPPWVYRGLDGALVLDNGVTRATRMARLAPGTMIRVEVVRELLKLIEELSAACPEYRFGQLVLNLAFLAREEGDRLAWHVEDAEFVEAARRHLADWSARHDKTDDAP